MPLFFDHAEEDTIGTIVLIYILRLIKLIRLIEVVFGWMVLVLSKIYDMSASLPPLILASTYVRFALLLFSVSKQPSISNRLYRQKKSN